MPQKPFPPPHEILSDLLISARKEAGVTQAELADRLGMGQSRISKVERGVQRLDLIELHRWLEAIGGKSFTDFAAGLDQRLRRQRSAERRWLRATQGKSHASPQLDKASRR